MTDRPMTEAEQAVIDAAVEWLDVEDANNHGIPWSPKPKLQALRSAISELHNEHDGRYQA